MVCSEALDSTQGDLSILQNGNGPMKSNVPAGAVMPENLIPPDTQAAIITQDDLNKAAEARGKLIEMFG